MMTKFCLVLCFVTLLTVTSAYRIARQIGFSPQGFGFPNFPSAPSFGGFPNPGFNGSPSFGMPAQQFNQGFGFPGGFPQVAGQFPNFGAPGQARPQQPQGQVPQQQPQRPQGPPQQQRPQGPPQQQRPQGPPQQQQSQRPPQQQQQVQVEPRPPSGQQQGLGQPNQNELYVPQNNVPFT